jgi:type I restriction enzyme S subunit
MRDVMGWRTAPLSASISALDAGVSVNAEDRPHRTNEIGVLKTSALSGGSFHPEQNKAVLYCERAMVAEPVVADSILLSRMNTPALVGESCYVCKDYPSLFLPDRIWQLKPKNRGEISMRWLSYVLRNASTRSYIELHASGTSNSMKNLPKSRMLALNVDYPPVTEQRLIAGVLDTLDIAVRRTEAIIEKLKQVKQGLLHDLLTRGIDANGELRPPQSEAPHLYKESPLGLIPKDWEVVPLLNKIDLPEGQVDPRIKPYVDWILVAPDHIESGTGRLLGEKTAADQGAISGKYLCKAGDVLYSKIRPYLRKAIIAAHDVLCSADMYPFTPRDSVNSQFLLAVILGDEFSRFAESVSMRTGMPKINRAELAECNVAWPSRNEQDRTVDVLAALLNRQETAAADLAKLSKLKEGLADDLLTGRVRVTPLLDSASTPA